MRLNIIATYGLMLAAGVGLGVVGMSMHHDVTYLIAQDGQLVCEWDGCRYDAIPYHLDHRGSSGFDNTGSCHGWARGAALDEIRSCEPVRDGVNGEIWVVPGSGQWINAPP